MGAIAVDIPEDQKSGGNVIMETNCPHGIQFLESYNRFIFNLSPSKCEHSVLFVSLVAFTI